MSHSELWFVTAVIVYLREVHDEVICIGLFCGLDYVLRGDTRPAVANVLGNGGGKEHGFLLHNANQRAQPLNVEAPDVMAIQSHLRWTRTKGTSFSQTPKSETVQQII